MSNVPPTRFLATQLRLESTTLDAVPWRSHGKARIYFNSVDGIRVDPRLQAFLEWRTEAGPGMLATRRESVEHPFGTVKHWMGQGTFLMRGLENVRGEFSLTALAYNLRRAINLLGIPTLPAAVHSGS